jgi:hypothetical protein
MHAARAGFEDGGDVETVDAEVIKVRNELARVVESEAAVQLQPIG